MANSKSNTVPYSRGHKRTSDYKRTLLFGPCLTSKFSVTLWENTFSYKHTPKTRQTRIYKHWAYERVNMVYVCFVLKKVSYSQMGV